MNYLRLKQILQPVRVDCQLSMVVRVPEWLGPCQHAFSGVLMQEEMNGQLQHGNPYRTR